MTLEASTPIGKYVIQHKLAEGGMAELYLATATGPEGFEKEVVIKRVRSFLAGDEGFVRMFIAEAQLASRLNHANVVQIFDFARHEDSYYLAMEYVRGCSLWELRKRCREKGVVIPPLLVAHIGAQVAAGLHHAHRLKSPDGVGLVHRDVTPHNVLLSLDGAVKLTDFGIAKAGHTQSGMLKGKFAYMAPEQARGEEVDARTDVFALGIVLWEMLTGGRLFDGDSDVAVLRAVRERVITPPARLNPDVPEALDEVVSMALERDPEARFPSAGEMERALAWCVLSHARSVDDTDVGAFVRRLLDESLTPLIQTPAAPVDRAQRSVRERSEEPTAVLPGTGTSSGRGRSGRTAPPEESLSSASTLVLMPAAPARLARGMPVVTSVRESAGAKRGGKGLWVGVGVAALVLIGGAAALVLPVKEPAPTSMAPEVPNPVSVPTTGEAPVATSPMATSPETATAPDADAVEAVPPEQGVRGETPGAGGATPEVTSATEARGTLIVRAIPFATVIVSGQKPREVLGRYKYILPPGKYKVTFQHPSGSETHDVIITPEGSVTRGFIARKK